METVKKLNNSYKNQLNHLQNTKKTGLLLQDRYLKALNSCTPIKFMVDELIDLEFPVDAFSDKTLSKKATKIRKK